MASSGPSQPQIPEPSHGSVWLSVAGVLGCFLIFGFVLLVAYMPARKSAPTVDLSSIEEDQRWKFDADLRKKRLTELQAKNLEAATTYAWIDKSADSVRLPIERAMQLVVQENAPKK